MATITAVIIVFLVLALLFLGAARASSSATSSSVRQGASNDRPVAVAQAELAGRSSKVQTFVTVPQRIDADSGQP